MSSFPVTLVISIVWLLCKISDINIFDNTTFVILTVSIILIVNIYKYIKPTSIGVNDYDFKVDIKIAAIQTILCLVVVSYFFPEKFKTNDIIMYFAILADAMRCLLKKIK